MNIREIIATKKKGLKLSNEQIKFFVDGVLSGEVADYQASALLMAICLKGLDFEETVALTRAMRYSGRQNDLSKYRGIKIDKHSTGGVGDTTSFIIMPVLGALGYKCVKMSGMGLGHTGGTLDKLDSVGARHDLTDAELKAQIDKLGFAIIGQTADICPADKYLYTLRDVTETVDCIPLIAASIMSKKLASGCDVIVLDVKYGNGAFMRNFSDAIDLAETMCDIGRAEGKKTIALITDMNEPLSTHIGNAIEVEGVIEVLSGKQCKLRDLAVALATNAVCTASGLDYATAFEMVKSTIDSGKALDYFTRMIEAQGGSFSEIKKADFVTEIKAKHGGYVHGISAIKMGEFVCSLGGGRSKKEDKIDYGVGAILSVRVGDSVKKGDRLVKIYSREPLSNQKIKEIESIFEIKSETLDKPRMIYAKINEEGEILL